MSPFLSYDVSDTQHVACLASHLQAVDVILAEKDGVILEWQASAQHDAVADAVMATVLQIESVPSSVKGKSLFFFVRCDFIVWFFFCLFV